MVDTCGFKVLVQVAALVGGFPQPAAGSDALLSEIGAAVEQVRAATTARELYTPLLVVLERHGDSVDEWSASLNDRCALPEDEQLVRPAAMISDWLRWQLA